MTDKTVNIHATAIVAGTRGLLFIGPSGSGKSALAFACLAHTKARGAFGALIADDQVFVRQAGAAVIASCPPAIRGLVELRYSGLATVESLDEAVLHLVIRLADSGSDERLPPENEQVRPGGLSQLPMIRLLSTVADPLAAIGALHRDFVGERPFT